MSMSNAPLWGIGMKYGMSSLSSKWVRTSTIVVIPGPLCTTACYIGLCYFSEPLAGIWYLYIESIPSCITQGNRCHFRDHFVYAPSQWETTLHCNVISHWLSTYSKWSLQLLSPPNLSYLLQKLHKLETMQTVLFLYHVADKHESVRNVKWIYHTTKRVVSMVLLWFISLLEFDVMVHKPTSVMVHKHTRKWCYASFIH